MHPEAERLFALDEALRAEADQVLAESGIGAILEQTGYVPVGSYAMHTMTWRDLDFELYTDPDWDAHWEIGTRLAKTGWCFRLACDDESRYGDPIMCGLYWGLRVAEPGRGGFRKDDGVYWKMDLWRAPLAVFDAHAGERRRRWQALMADELRSYILAIKEAVCLMPEYRRTIASVQIYEAVLEHGIRDLQAFREWHQLSSP